MDTHHPLATRLASAGSHATTAFSRLFPQLQALDFDDATAADYARAVQSVEVDDNPDMPAAYTYFGQFLDHDLTFDPVPRIDDRRAGSANSRTPRFDLDSLYGFGFVADPHLYDRGSPGLLLLGKGRDHRRSPPTTTNEDDLPRNSQAIALVGDPRNDQNVMVSQIHLAFLRLHNRLYRERIAAGEDAAAAFEAARRTLQWHYQWVVLHDFLPRLVGSWSIAAVLEDGNGPARERFRGNWFKIESPQIPLEFSGAIYRFGHTMVRNAYVLSDDFENRLGPRKIFSADGNGGNAPDLRGGRFLPRAWSLQWDRFLKFPGSVTPQAGQRIDRKMANSLRTVPGFDPSDLALRNLVRGRSLSLPAGQDVAHAMGLTPLPAPRPQPLWLYVLREAEESADGRRLGPVAARIVAEVMVGILAADPNSYLNVAPDWQPSTSMLAPGSTAFELKDLIHAAGLPCNRSAWLSWVERGFVRMPNELGPLPGEILPERGTHFTGRSISLHRGKAAEVQL